MADAFELLKEHGPVAGMLATVSAIGGAIVSAYVNKKKNDADHDLADRKEDRDDFSLVTSALKSQLDDARAENTRLRTDLDFIKLRVTLRENNMPSSPFPEWLLSTDGKYIWCNEAFEVRLLLPFGYSRGWLNGKAHSDMWPPETAQIFEALDAQIAKRPSRTASLHGVVIPKEIPKFSIFKWGVPDRVTQRIVGYRGQMIPEDF